MPESLTFVLCIENNGIREQALLLCESIRLFAGRFRQSPIWAFAPRPGMGVDEKTRDLLTGMKVDYFDEPLNESEAEYGPANRVAAGAWAEARADSEWLVVVDSDTVFLAEPEVPEEADVVARPVDLKGAATRGPEDELDAYWKRLADLGGTSTDRLPFLRTSVSGERIRASFNGGLMLVRRELGVLKKCADIFHKSVAAGLAPRPGTPVDVRASLGPVGLRASEYWGSSQAALAFAAYSSTSRVQLYPDSYNIPLHLLAHATTIDPKWRAAPPVHVHYHWMFAKPDHTIALTTLRSLGAPEDRLVWLEERLPLA